MTLPLTDALLGCLPSDLSHQRCAGKYRRESSGGGHDLIRIRSLVVPHQCLVCPPHRVVTHRAVGEVIGADTHLDTIHVVALTENGQPLGDAEFPTNPTGYYVAIARARSFGEVLIAGVEGTSSYGAGITRALQDNGIEVVEVNRPDRTARRRQDKSDPLDAYSAARTVLAGHGLAVPKDANTGALKALLIARGGAVKARTAAIQQIKDLLVTGPAELRERYRRYATTLRLVQALARCRPSADTDSVTIAVLTACKALAERIEFLEDQVDELTTEIDTLTTALNPALRAAFGVAPTPRHSCSSPPAPTPTAYAHKPRSPCSAVSPRSRPLRSPGRCSNTSPHPARSTTTATYARPGKPKTSPWPPPRPTSASGPTTSPDSKPPTTADG